MASSIRCRLRDSLRQGVPALLLGLLAASPGEAAGLSMGHEFLPQGTLLADCMARSSDAVRQVGLDLLKPTSRAVWGQTPDASQLYTIYCLPERTAVRVIGTAERADMVDPTVVRLREILRGGGNPKR